MMTATFSRANTLRAQIFFPIDDARLSQLADGVAPVDDFAA